MCDPTLQFIASVGAQVAGAQAQNRATKNANRSMAMLMDQNAAKTVRWKIAKQQRYKTQQPLLAQMLAK